MLSKDYFELFLIENGFLAIGKKGKYNIWNKDKFKFIIKEITRC